jgi:hypothetical protein
MILFITAWIVQPLITQIRVRAATVVENSQLEKVGEVGEVRRELSREVLRLQGSA